MYWKNAWRIVLLLTITGSPCHGGIDSSIKVRGVDRLISNPDSQKERVSPNSVQQGLADTCD